MLTNRVAVALIAANTLVAALPLCAVSSPGPLHREVMVIALGLMQF